MATVELRLSVTQPEGLHARPATALVELLNQYAPDATVRTADHRLASGVSVLEIMLLGVKQGESIWIQTDSELPNSAVIALQMLVRPPGTD